VVVVWVRVEDCFLGYRAIACPCLCRPVESSSCVFTLIGCGCRIRGILGFRRCFGSVESVGRSWRSLMIFPGYLVLRLVGRDVAIASDRSRSESIGRCRRVQGGLILCYTQALGVVGVGSLLVELSWRIRVRSGRPSCRASQGQNYGVRRSYRDSGKSGNRPEDQMVHK
jgi:hypothetical protein